MTAELIYISRARGHETTHQLITFSVQTELALFSHERRRDKMIYEIEYYFRKATDDVRLTSDFSSLSIAACGQHNGIKPQDPIRCRSCGYRILYKVRTKRSKSFYSLALLSVVIEIEK